MIDVKSLLVKFGTDTAAMEAGFKKADGLIQRNSEKFKKAGKTMAVAGAAIVGSIGLMVKSYVKAGDEVHKMALRTGFSTEALSELKYAAQISGTSITSLEKGIKKMASSIGEAKLGVKTYTDAFKLIGIEVKELEGLNPEEQFMKMAAGIAEIEDPTQRAYAAQKLLGRAGTELLPLFAEGAEGMENLRQKARDLGISISGPAAEGAAELNDAMTDLKGSFKGVTMALAEQLAPIIKGLSEKITGVVTRVKDWIKEHPKLAGTLIKVVGAAGALAAVLGPILIMLPGLAVAFGALTWPIAAVIAGVAALIAVGGLVIKHWEPIKNFFKDLWESVSGFFVNAFKSIEKKLLDWAISITSILAKIPIVKKLAGPWKESLEKMRAELDRTVSHVEDGATAIKKFGKSIGKAWIDAIKGTELFKDAAAAAKKETGWLAKGLAALNVVTKEVIKETPTLTEEFETLTEVIETEVHPALRKIGGITQQAVLAAMLGTGLLKEDLMNLSAIFPEELEPSALNTFEILNKAVDGFRDRTFVGTTEIKKHWKETFWEIAEVASTVVSGLDACFAQAYENQMIRIDNEEKRTLEAIDNKYDATIEANEAIVEAEKAKTKDILKSIDDDYNAKKKYILNNVKDEEARDAMLADLEKKHELDLEQARTDREIAEQETADNLEAIEEAKNEALRIASEELEIKRAAARKTAAKQEKAVALLAAIVNTAAAVVKALPNIPLAIAVGVLGAIQIALIKAQPIPLKEGGVVTGPTKALIGEAGPELVIPLNKLQPALAGAGGVNQYNYFYGDINNAGDLDEISKRLAERTRRAIERGRR